MEDLLHGTLRLIAVQSYKRLTEEAQIGFGNPAVE
jgi:hypothetical protein